MSSCGKSYPIKREYSTVQQLSGTLSGRIRACLVEYIMTEMSASKYIAQGESLEEKLLQKERWFLFHESVTGQKSQISNPSSASQNVIATACGQNSGQSNHPTRWDQNSRQSNHPTRWEWSWLLRPSPFQNMVWDDLLLGKISQNLTFEMSTVRIIS